MEYRIQLDVLSRAIAGLISDHIKRTGSDYLYIEDGDELYWAISPEDLIVKGDDKPDLDIGNLIEDWDFLRGMIENDRTQALMIWHAYPILAYLTRRIILDGKKIG